MPFFWWAIVIFCVLLISSAVA
ncbi:MAG: hypothetical protein ACD_43C00167G0001, partial [uncultured bacterium]